MTPSEITGLMAGSDLVLVLAIRHNESMRQVLLYRGKDGLVVAECPSLPGCVSQGETHEAALANIREAIQAYVGALEADRLPVPEEHFDARLVTV
jgi:predicted RNase H-like HicB family nuclease